MGKVAFISGCNGQDGSYLTELLLLKGYSVHGLVRRNSSGVYPNIEGIRSKITLHYGDVITDNHLCSLVNEIKPDELYHLAAQSHVGLSFQCPEYTSLATGMGVLNVLEAIRNFSPNTRLYNAGTSELFGNALAPQNEFTPMNPQSPYACAKLFGYHMVKIYRKAYGMFACNGVCFNHESVRRPIEFVTRKVTHAVASIVAGKQDKLYLGNLDARRDWGYAPEYVKAMFMMLQQNKPDDYVIGTGETHSIRELVDLAFSLVKLDPAKYVVVDDQFKRPAEVNLLQADATKADVELGWHSTISFKQLVMIMLEADLKEVK